MSASLIDSPAAWKRLAISLGFCTFGSIGFWSYVVALPAVQASYGVTRAEASLPYTVIMLSFGLGGLVMGWLMDRHGVMRPCLISAACIVAGYVLSALAPNMLAFTLSMGLLGFGASTSFAPLLSDISHWFLKRRGLAVTIVSSGNYIAGTIWPTIIQWAVEEHGWRNAHYALAVISLIALVPFSIALRAPPPHTPGGKAMPAPTRGTIAIPQKALLWVLVAAGFTCCAAMAMPQVHLVAYCADLGYGPARGAQIVSMTLGLGIISRILSGLMADRIGGLLTLIIGSTMQAVALFLYTLFDGLSSIVLISALFGLFQGGIIPMYAVIVREYFPANKAGSYIGLVIMATVVGMGAGGWMSGVIFDWTGSYRAAFFNGAVWNLVNMSLVALIIMRRRDAPAKPAL
jgi:MFS family permease